LGNRPIDFKVIGSNDSRREIERARTKFKALVFSALLKEEER